ncbi:MAG: glycoside hydrolase family 25 protein [Anaerolineae bacterium]|nr:glycoside hydrolase family 25 protein [Anaerolineae bacterium]
MDRAKGIDVSRYQGAIDWTQVAQAGYSFAALRATIGDYYTDPRFVENWAGAQSNAILTTAYHVVKPGIAADAQMMRLFDALSDRRPDLPLALDVELKDAETAQRVLDMTRACLEILVGEGYRAIVYTGAWFWNTLPVAAIEWDDDADLWTAAYTAESYMLQKAWPRGWQAGNWRFWQHSNKGRVPGIVGDVDLDVFNGSLNDLLRYAGKSKTPPELQERRFLITVRGHDLQTVLVDVNEVF